MTLYQQNRHLLRAGDVIVFRGAGSPLSFLIELFAPTESHTAIVRQPAVWSCSDWHDVLIAESTRPMRLKAGDRNGVQSNPLGTVIELEYAPRGTATALLLSAASRQKIDWQKFYRWIGACQDHVSYDVQGLFDFLLRDIPMIGARVAQGEKLDRMVCSAFVCSTLTRCGLLNGMNWSKCSPQDLVELGIYERSLPLLGNQKLVRFDTLA